MSAQKIQLRYEEFATSFLAPTLLGGPVVTGRPLTPGMLEHFSFASTSDPDLDRQIYDQIHEGASLLAPLRALTFPERGLAAIAMAAHNLAAATDPLLDRWGSRGARNKMIEYADWFIEAANVPQTRGEALSRHAFLERFLILRREDVTAHNWAFTHQYLGRPVPEGFFTKPRWVDITTKRTEILHLWQVLDQEVELTSRLRQLLSRSPVTELLEVDVVRDLRFGLASLAVLSDDVVRNGLARALVAQGPAVARALGEAFHALAQQNPPPSLLYYPLALMYEMHVIATLDGRAGQAAAFGPVDSDGAALFMAVLPAMVGAPDDLSSLLDLDPDDLALLRKRAAELDGSLKREAIKMMVELVDRATPPRLDHESESLEVHL
ncbi:MAG: hypothetical protein AAGF12_12645 [Myxococcota bacterium]